MLARMLAGLLPRHGTSVADCYRRATAARERGDWAQAVDWYRRALAARPDHADAHNDLGIALCALKDFAGARAAFTQALALRGEFVPAEVNLGQLLQSEFRDYRQAAVYYRAALAVDPGQGQAREQSGADAVRARTGRGGDRMPARGAATRARRCAGA